MDWKIALKVTGPSAIAAWVFSELINNYLVASEIFKTNLYLNFTVLVFIFLFCVVMGFLWVRRGKEKVENKIENNEICDNEVGEDLSIGCIESDIVNNKISNNKVEGSINIGSNE